MIELNEKREMMTMAIEGELMDEVVDMVLVEEYEEILAGIEFEIIQLLDIREERILEEEYEMEKSIELEVFVNDITLEANWEFVEKEEDVEICLAAYTPVEKETIKLGFYEQGLDKEYGRPTESNYTTNAELTFVNNKIISVRPFKLVDTEAGGGTLRVYREAFDVDATKVGKKFNYSLYSN